MSAILHDGTARRTVRRARAPRPLLGALVIAACAAAALPAALGAQEDAGAQAIARRVAAAGDGVVRLSFAAREGVCGHGGEGVRIGRSTIQWGGERVREWESDCEAGPVRVSLSVARGEVTALRTYVGGRWADTPSVPVTDLGTVAAPAAAAYLLSLAAGATGDPAQKAILPATLADSATVWPTLLRIARDERRPEGVRRDAVFWVGQAAGEAASRGLSELVDQQDANIGVREQAVFALSQRPADESVPALIRVARTSQSPRLRQRAIFWLGQSKDARALAFFEELLIGR